MEETISVVVTMGVVAALKTSVRESGKDERTSVTTRIGNMKWS